LVNVIIWPTTAEHDLTSQICISLTNLISFHVLLLKKYLLSLNESELSRLKSFSIQIRSDAFSLVRIIDALEAELTYSKFSTKEYKDQVRCINLMQLHLLGLYNNMSKRCNDRFDKDSLHLLKENAMELSEVCRKSIISIERVIDPHYHKNKKIAKIIKENECEIIDEEVEVLNEKICQENLQKSLKEYEEKQRNIMIELLHLNNIILDDVFTENITSTKDDESIITIESENRVKFDDDIILKESTWEDIFFSYFFTFGFREYVEELLRLGMIVNEKSEKKLRINYKWMIPDLFKKKKVNQIKSEDTKDVNYSNPIATIRVKLAKFLYAFKSNISISAIKSAVALIIYILPLLIGGSAKDFFVRWNINTGVVSVIIVKNFNFILLKI
jgi:hypothetical protein